VSRYKGLDPKTVTRLKARERRRAALAEKVARALDATKAQERRVVVPGLAIGGEKMPGDRTLSGYGAVFNNPDYHKDIITPGAFDRWLRWYNGHPEFVPLLWDRRQGEPLVFHAEHEEEDPRAVLGHAEQVKTDHHGLFSMFRLLPETGEAVFRKVRKGEWDGLSIGYRIIDSRPPTWEERQWGAKHVLTDVWVREISLVKTPANTAARVYAVKSRAELLVDSVRHQLAAHAGTAPDPALVAKVERALAAARRVQ
jgi:HK97 family phage prohead protease